MSDQVSNVLLVTKWKGDDGNLHVRVLAADMPHANELTTDARGALRWIESWMGLPK